YEEKKRPRTRRPVSATTKATRKNGAPKKWPNKRAFSVAALLLYTRPQRISSAAKRAWNDRGKQKLVGRRLRRSRGASTTKEAKGKRRRSFRIGKPTRTTTNGQSSYFRRSRSQRSKRQQGRSRPNKLDSHAARQPAQQADAPVVHSVSDSPVAEAA
ncbi:unnamed protein product, partial [Ixodes hexagonus]